VVAMIGWNFPSNNFGQVTGLNDAGIETFKGNPWESLAREINQNSCDAKQAGVDRPVEVHFKHYSIPIENFPGRENFIEVLRACQKYWSNNNKSKQFFDRTLQVFRSDKIDILKISDYNTTGLTGSDKDYATNWHNLIKSVGVSDKNSSSGGSFGIGKHAPFACSLIRTVFYGTKDIEGKFAFQGVSKLVTHEGVDGLTTQGTGYFGSVNRNNPITDINRIPELFRRNDTGTDVFIMGFNSREDWQSKIIKSVIENFFIAINDNRLIVHVGDKVINSSSLEKLIEAYIKDDSECLSEKYYRSLTEQDERHVFAEDDFEGLGKVELFVLPNKEYPKRVAMVRGTGMKIYDKGHFQTPMKFAGVMIAKGEKLNAFLRSIEPPSHNSWEPERYEENPDFARSLIKKLNSWINSKVRSISYSEDAEEMDVEGMSQYLPDESDDSPLMHGDNDPEGQYGAPKQIEIKDVYRPNNPEVNVASDEAAATDESNDGNGAGEEFADENSDEQNETKGGDASNGWGAPATGDGSNGSVDNGVGPSDTGDRTSRARRPVTLKQVRIFCSNIEEGMYSVSFAPDSNGTGNIRLNIVGEVGEELAPIHDAYFKDSGMKIKVTNGEIGPIEFKAGIRSAIMVKLAEQLRCALEVSANESKA
jgi:hypothetical protein